MRTLTYSSCVGIEIIIAVFIAIFTALGNQKIVSLLLTLSFITLFLFTFCYIRTLKRRGSLILLVIACFLSVFCNTFFEGGVFTFNYFKKAIMFISFIIFLNATVKENFYVSTRVIKIVKILPLLGGVGMVFSFFFLGNTKTLAGAVTLGFSNPNFTGMWLLHFILYGFIFLLDRDVSLKWKVIYIPILTMLMYLLILTQARSCLIGVFLFLLLLIMSVFRIKLNKVLVIGIVLFPLLYSIVYLNIVNTEWFQKTFQFAAIEGKSLVSRVDVWNFAFENFLNHPITGNYYGISYGTGQSQMHNTHVDVLASYGIFVFLLFIVNLYKSIMATYKSVDSTYKYSALVAFCSILCVGSFEAAIVAGAAGLNLLTVGLLVVAKYGNDGE